MRTDPLLSRARSHNLQTAIHSNWQLAATAPGAVANASDLAITPLSWCAAVVPGTVAQSLGIEIGEIGKYDAQDWWYRTRFAANAAKNLQQRLHFEGLATLANVWLNGTLILNARNMFVPHSVAVSDLLRDDNELVICFRALDTELALRKPRPRWKTALVPQQNMRWIRTTLLGRIPGWTPPIDPVGPWKSIYLEQSPLFDIDTLGIQTTAKGNNGAIAIDVQITLHKPVEKIGATLHVGTHAFALTSTHNSKNAHLSGKFTLADIALWWPHTHGAPTLHECRITLEIGAIKTEIDCGRVGFKHI